MLRLIVENKPRRVLRGIRRTPNRSCCWRRSSPPSFWFPHQAMGNPPEFHRPGTVQIPHFGWLPIFGGDVDCVVSRVRPATRIGLIVTARHRLRMT